MIFLILIYASVCLGLLSAFISSPAFFILRKRKMIYIFEYGSVFYALLFFNILDSFYEYFGNSLGVSNYCTETFIICLIGISINYIRLAFPNRFNKNKVAIGCLATLFLVTVFLYYFIPPFGE